MRETRRCQMSVPARSLMVATSTVAVMSRRVSQSLTGARIAVLFAAVVSVVAAAAAQAGAADATRIRVNTFPNAKALAVHVGIAKGLFAKYGLAVELENTESSQSQRDGLAAGRFQIAHAALDNAVAMIEVAKRDVVIVS